MIIVLVVVGLCTGIFTFLALIWSQNLLVALLGAMFVGSLMTVLTGAVAALRGTDSAERGDEEWDDVTTDDQRTAARLQGFTRGRLRWDKGEAESDCIVQDLSITGARLGIPNSVSLPEFVELEIAGENRTVAAKVRWRMADQVGVEFLERSAGHALDSSDLEEQIAALKAEIVRLRAMLEDRWANPRQRRK